MLSLLLALDCLNTGKVRFSREFSCEDLFHKILMFKYRVSGYFRNDLIFAFFFHDVFQNGKLLNTQKLYSVLFSIKKF